MPRKSTREEFITKANTVHHNKYDYSKVKYINSITKVCIICPEHGKFWQTPSNHIHYGCAKCSIKLKPQCQSDKNNFISKAKQIHQNKFDYSKVVYINNKTKILIICPEHGEFWQIPINHLKYGCMQCKNKLQSINQKGKNNPNFNSKLTEEERKKNHSISGIGIWKKEVKKRDNHTCQKCGSKEHLQAHHINNFSHYQNQRILVENGITLCKDCHKSLHKAYGLFTTKKHIKLFFKFIKSFH